ncbi:hypothetical protein NXV59_00010 [Bacteroides fragilis]|nr:hypothetical protein [Bacteroides fragilis]
MNSLLSKKVVRFVDNLKFISTLNIRKCHPHTKKHSIYKLGVDGETFSKSGFNVKGKHRKRDSKGITKPV